MFWSGAQRETHYSTHWICRATLDIAAALPIATSTPLTNLRQYINSDLGYNDLKIQPLCSKIATVNPFEVAIFNGLCLFVLDLLFSSKFSLKIATSTLLTEVSRYIAVLFVCRGGLKPRSIHKIASSGSVSLSVGLSASL